MGQKKEKKRILTEELLSVFRGHEEVTGITKRLLIDTPERKKKTGEDRLEAAGRERCCPSTSAIKCLFSLVCLLATVKMESIRWPTNGCHLLVMKEQQSSERPPLAAAALKCRADNFISNSVPHDGICYQRDPDRPAGRE